MTTETTQDAAGAIRLLGTAYDTYGPTLNTYAAATAVETIGRALADLLQDHAPGQIGIWNTSDDAVLAHVVARELGATVVRASELEGVVSFYPQVSRGVRIALIATAWEKPRWLRTLLAVAATDHAEVVAAAAVLDTPALQDMTSVPTLHLVAGADEVLGVRGDEHQR